MLDHLPVTLAQESAQPAVGGGNGGSNTGAAPPGATSQPGTTSPPGTTSQPGAAPGGGVSPSGSGQGPGGFGSLLFFFGLIAVMFLVITMGQRREKKKRASLLAAIKKGDKVQTIGGMIGTLVEVRDADVVLKVDENANVRIKFSRAAIQSVLGDEKE